MRIRKFQPAKYLLSEYLVMLLGKNNFCVEQYGRSLYENLRSSMDASSSIPVESKSKVLLHNIGVKEGMANVGDHRNEILKVDKDQFRSELNIC